MQTASGLPIRKRIRLRDFHYGADCVYYVTICTHEKRLMFGHCVDGIVTLNTPGTITSDEWMRTFAMRPFVSGEKFIVMPNHVHAHRSIWEPGTVDLAPNIVSGLVSLITIAGIRWLFDERRKAPR